MLDEFAQFDNTAGVFVGNEVLTTAEGSHAAPFVLAAARDVKAYRNQKGYREIPVGYSAADIADLRPMLQNYLACADKAEDRLDFYSLNAYEWCGSSSYKTSGYDQLQKNATDYPIPIFFSETGCNQPAPRDFEDQSAIFGENMEGTWSGSIIYEWIEETNDYGLISYGPSVGAEATNTIVQEGYTRQGTPSPVQPDFNNLKSQWAKVSPTGVALSEYRKSTASIKAIECPASTSGGWAVDPSAALPTLGEKYNSDSATKTGSSGSSGSGSQTGSSSSTSTTNSNAANAVMGATSPATERLLAASLVLSSVFGIFAFWL